MNTGNPFPILRLEWVPFASKFSRRSESHTVSPTVTAVSIFESPQKFGDSRYASTCTLPAHYADEVGPEETNKTGTARRVRLRGYTLVQLHDGHAHIDSIEHELVHRREHLMCKRSLWTV
jgi:hypothetical protein